MQNAQPPTQVQDAFLDAIKAREDQEADHQRGEGVPGRRGPQGSG